ncbi:MAG: serine hydrolase [Flavipsychrobacter sp.]|nr:serine hydrolase [Flavipsychrobacter sp.]
MRIPITLLIMLFAATGNAQSTVFLADSVRRAYRIPELSYAVVSADTVLEIQATGVRKKGTQMQATLNDRFRIGSNTKAITGFIAAQLVKQGKLSWNTKFFDLFPEMKTRSRKEYYPLTLLDLLSFRTKLFPYTYTDAQPVKSQFTGNETQQRYQFTQWFFKHEPVHKKDSICFSNLGYVAAGLMLEKASGKPYKQLVTELGKQMGIDFEFGPPNFKDKQQTWGHNEQLVPEPPADNYKLNWLLPAGNINVTLPGYAKFIQLQLLGLQGKSNILTREEFNFLHFGLPQFGVGWFNDSDENKKPFTYNIGNPGTFLTKVYVLSNSDRAIIIFLNAQTDEADEGSDMLYMALKRKYCKQ